jgi:hypothetical protein
MKEITQLLEITANLKELYKDEHKRNFTLDGKLVGDIGEVLVAQKYGLTLYPENHPTHDAFEKTTKRNIQIKSTFRGSTTYFPKTHFPDYFLVVKILPNGDLEEIFNGPGSFIVENYIQARNIKSERKYAFSLSTKLLKELNMLVHPSEKINLIN